MKPTLQFLSNEEIQTIHQSALQILVDAAVESGCRNANCWPPIPEPLLPTEAQDQIDEVVRAAQDT